VRFDSAALKRRTPLAIVPDVALGFGHEARVLRDRIDGWCRDYDFTASTKTKSLEDEFSELVQQWNISCGPTSSLTQMISDANYLRIIGLGRPAIPLLLRELVERPDHWDLALRAITGVTVTEGTDEGNLARTAAKWIRWGKEHGYLQ
jgi:hypothetical protein